MHPIVWWYIWDFWWHLGNISDYAIGMFVSGCEAETYFGSGIERDILVLLATFKNEKYSAIILKIEACLCVEQKAELK